MKKYCLIVVALLAFVTNVNAQKTVVKTETFSSTQARMVEVTAKSYVRPLVIELVVKKGQNRMVFKQTYSRNDVDVAMRGSLDNLRSRVIYDATEDPAWNCDAVVAPTFKIDLSQDQSMYIVEMKGFPANFDPNSWHPLGKGDEAQDDYKWLELDKRVSFDKAEGAVIKNVKN